MAVLAATPDEQPERAPEFAVVPVRNGWSVYDEVTDSAARLLRPLSLVDAELATQALIDMPGRVVQFAWAPMVADEEVA